MLCRTSSPRYINITGAPSVTFRTGSERVVAHSVAACSAEQNRERHQAVYQRRILGEHERRDRRTNRDRDDEVRRIHLRNRALAESANQDRTIDRERANW